MVLSDALVEEIFSTLIQTQSLLQLQIKSIVPLIAKIQSEAQKQQQSESQESAPTLNGQRPNMERQHANSHKSKSA